MLSYAPQITPTEAADLARRLYSLTVTARQLPSERDQNFLLEIGGAPFAVLKVANALESRALLDAQQCAMAHVSSLVDVVPRVIKNTDGETISLVRTAAGTEHLVWAVTHLPGSTLATLTRRTPALLEDFGRRIASLRSAFATFDHPAIHRDFHWDLANARAVVTQHRSLIDDADSAAAIDSIVREFDRLVTPLLPELPTGAVHGDLNDHNVLVGGGDDLYSSRQRITGVVDFGDMVHSYAVADLAIAAAYVSLGSSDPLTDVASLVRGYNSVMPLAETEITALFGLMAMRLCASACVAADQRRQTPENSYLDVSQAAIRQTLPLLARIPFGLATAVFRNACGLEPVPGSARVREWLASHTADFAHVIGVDLRTEECAVLDLGIGSALVSGDTALNDEAHLSRRLASKAITIGQYDEPRLLYTAPFFANAWATNGERRTIHIGLDIFTAAGTPVFAPLDGTVHAFAENRLTQDYGPVIVLRHATDDGVEFFTLYGHLSRASIEHLTIGQSITRGERFAWFGTPEENVGWTPHLHLQIITDTLGLDTDFPGVAPASQREVWRSLSPDPNLIVGIPTECFPPARATKRASLERRQARLARNLSIAYRDPVRIERGWQQYLYDDVGRRYIDAYNNVPHVGHAHPRIVDAACRQMAVLNTNTRYLNDQLAEYAERLTATLPQGLDVCVLVNSASEANELALRMARAYTQRRDMIVLDAAYHGNTTSLIDISPYKHAGPGGTGTPEWVHVAPLPDDYRGPFKRGDPHGGLRHALPVAELVHRVLDRGRSLAGFIAETCPSVGGQLILPPRYLAEVYRHIRAAGGVCIADEVQTGLGRMGTHFWAFEAQGVVPDIVVMGKPLGNGHPMAAVVTTRDIADSFDNGMEYFSTFGGNNVSCAVGLAVLDVLRDEQLQAHALRVGERLLAGLRTLADRFSIIGDVRGTGLFLGVELVRNRETLEPAGTEASFVANRMREMGILLGTDGPYHNVVKIRPPMPFNDDDADELLGGFERILREDFW